MPDFLEVQASFRGALKGECLPVGISSPNRIDLERRFSVYRNNVMAGLTNALRRRFPVVERLLGEEFARAMFGVYIANYPPQSPIILRYGMEMAEFVESFPPVASLPYLSDIARLEFARGVAYHAADAESVPSRELQRIAADDPDTFGLEVHPSVQVLVSRYPLYTIWQGNQPGRKPTRISSSEGEAVLVARAGLTVVTERVSVAEAEFLTGLLDQRSYSDSAAAALDRDSRFDPTLILSKLFRAELVTGVTGLTAGLNQSYSSSCGG